MQVKALGQPFERTIVVSFNSSRRSSEPYTGSDPARRDNFPTPLREGAAHQGQGDSAGIGPADAVRCPGQGRVARACFSLVRLRACVEFAAKAVSRVAAILSRAVPSGGPPPEVLPCGRHSGDRQVKSEGEGTAVKKLPVRFVEREDAALLAGLPGELRLAMADVAMAARKDCWP